MNSRDSSVNIVSLFVFTIVSSFLRTLNKIRDSSVSVVSVFVFIIIFCFYIKILLLISNFLQINKAIVSNWYQNLHDKLTRECVENVLQSLHSRLIYQKS